MERTFLKEQAKKREKQQLQQDEDNFRREEDARVGVSTRESKEKTSIWSRLRGRRSNIPEQVTETAPVSGK